MRSLRGQKLFRQNYLWSRNDVTENGNQVLKLEALKEASPLVKGAVPYLEHDRFNFQLML